MNYMLCPECGAVQLATVDSSAAHIICIACGHKAKASKLCCKMCPDCQSLLYSPPALLEKAVFPCAREHEEEKAERRRKAVEERKAEEERKAAEAAAENAARQPEAAACEPTAPAEPEEDSPASPYPPIPCEDCGAAIKPAGNEYPACPVCGGVPSRYYVHEQLYKLGGPLAPLQIKWHPQPMEMIHIDQYSAAIPPYSVVIVGEDQAALYKAGGSSVWLTGGNTYPLFDDFRTEDQIVEGIYHGNSLEDSLGYRIDTKIIFFDKCIQNTAFSVPISLKDDEWLITLPVSVGIQLCEPETLTQNRQDLNDAKALTEELIGIAHAAISKEINQRLLDISEDQLDEAQKASGVRRLLRDAIVQEAAAIRQQVNLTLMPRYGLQAAFLEMDISAAELLNTKESDRVSCPVCGADNWVPRGSKNPFACRKCGAKLSWCITCGFTTTRITARHTKECTKCGFEKF